MTPPTVPIESFTPIRYTLKPNITARTMNNKEAVADWGLATKVAATIFAKAAITTNNVTYAKTEKRNLPLLPKVPSIICPMLLPSWRMEATKEPKS